MTDPATGTALSYSYNSMDGVSQISYGCGGDTRSFGGRHQHVLLRGERDLGLGGDPGIVMRGVGYFSWLADE